MKKTFLVLVLVFTLGLVFAQTTIHSNDCSSATANWTFYTGGGLAIQQGGYWLVDNVDDYIVSEPFDVTNYTSLTLNFKVATYGSGTNHACLVEYSSDGGTNWSSTTFTSATPTTSTYIDAGTWNLGTVSTNQLVFRWTSPSGGSKGVRIDNILFQGTSAGPAIVVDPSTLFGFGYIEGSGPSGENTLALTGSNLTANIVVSAPTNYEIASTSGGTFGSSLSFTPSGGNVAATVYVQLKAGLVAGSYNNEVISFVSSGATPQIVTCSGTVYKTEPTNHVTSFACGSETSASITVSWTDAAKVTPDGYIIKGSDIGYSSIADPVDGVSESWSTLVHTVSQGTQTYTFFGLDENTTYYFKIFPYTNSGTNIDYKVDGTIPQDDGTTLDSFDLLPGDIAIIGFQCDDLDQFAMVVLTDIPTGTVIYFTDKGWTGSAFITGETGILAWNVPDGGVTTGTIITVNADAAAGTAWTPSIGSVITTGAVQFSASGDQLIIFQGTVDTPTFIYAISSTTWLTTGTPTSNQTYLPTGLVDETTAHDWATNNDNGYYNITTLSGSKSEILASVGNESNWELGDTRYTFPEWDWEEPTPVELSSFTATINAQNYVTLTWVSQTETGLAGYYVYRSHTNQLGAAQLVSPIIPATNTAQVQSYVFTDTELFETGTYYYWLNSSDIDGSDQFHGPVSVFYNAEGDNPTPEIPLVTELKAVYPNPFNPMAFIPYSIAATTDVNFKIYNSRGQIVRDLNLGERVPGNYRITWDGTDYNGQPLANGVYYIKMTAGKDSFQRKAVLLK